MAERFSAQWWNDTALAAGGLTKSAIEGLTGLTFRTVWNPDGTIASFWYSDVAARAPGFATAGLLLSPGAGQAGQDVMEHIGDPNWGDWSVFVSPVGVVAPGANAAYEPVLSATAPAPSTTTTFAGSDPVPPSPSTGSGASAPTTSPDQLVSLPVSLSPLAPSVAPSETFEPIDGFARVAGQQTTPGAPIQTPAPAPTGTSGVLLAGLLLLGLAAWAAWIRPR